MYSHMIPFVPQKQETIEGPSGIALSTFAWGEHHAPHHLLFVHGGHQSKECFREQYEALALAGCYVIGFDLPWHGKSGPTREQQVLSTPHLWAQSITAVRHHFHLSDSVVLLAWSMGGLIVREYLHRNTHPIGGLIFIAPLLDLEEGMAAGQRWSPQSLRVFGQLSDEQEHFSARAAAFLRFVELLSTEKTPDYYTLGYNARSFLCAPSLGSILKSFVGGEVEAFLGRLPCPVLFIQGTLDELLPAEYTRSNIARISPDRVSLRELPCGHSPHLEMPMQFNDAVYQFLVSLEHRRTKQASR